MAASGLATIVGVFVTVAIVIGSLIVNIIILSKVNNVKSTVSKINDNMVTPDLPTCPPMPTDAPLLPTGNPKYQEAASYLMQGLNETFDPCEDFYSFTCGSYFVLHQNDLGNVSRVGTYDEGQTKINQWIYQQLEKTTNSSSTITQQITWKAAQTCNKYYSGNPIDKSADMYKEMKDLFGGIPFVDGDSWKAISDMTKFFGAVGKLELEHALGTLFSTLVTVDYVNTDKNGIFVGQPILALPREFYVKPQFLSQVLNRVTDVMQTLTTFYKSIKGKAVDLSQIASDIVNFEISIAIASWPDDQMRNYKQQYNLYNYAKLSSAFKSISLTSYVDALVAGNGQTDAQKQVNSLIITQPSFFSWLDSVFEGGLIKQETIVNYIAYQFIANNQDFQPADGKTERALRYHERRGRGLRNIGATREVRKSTDLRDICVGIITDLMPYGPGYFYTKNRADREPARADVKIQTGYVIESFREMVGTLTWMTKDSQAKAYEKADKLIQNYGYPEMLFGSFKGDDDARVDKYNEDYKGILNTDDFYEIMKILSKGMEVREFFKILNNDYTKDYWPTSRHNFLASPATVNAWYQPERNSITFPLAVLSEPYYDLTFPQAFNYGGQGGTGGHELTHGYDDEGVQFGPTGQLIANDDFHSGWMDANSTQGFIDMAQCVVSQFNTQCCPVKTGNVHCANGETTQGENIADLGGQQAAFRAYRKYVERNLKGVEEDRLPYPMNKYTPNQIFWISYGYSWCMLQRPDNLVRQILTNPHAPAQCRTNQVMQDIPQFASDFNCRQGQKMYPSDEDRCKVWVGQ
ncbi:unnamed protein product, partial [Mesorhabditis belari]|uniref:Uncharacterized protein n=1 Tax=Mesorhabditis belari TaxID=2138241 RepID=A0AAF3FL04_9BILA